MSFPSNLQITEKGLYVKNETKYTITVILSVIAPIQWTRINPGETHHFQVGQVWFTVTAKIAAPNDQPSLGKAVSKTLNIVSTVCSLTASALFVVATSENKRSALSGGFAAMNASSAFGHTNRLVNNSASLDVVKHGVYADGRTISVVTCNVNGLAELSIEDTNNSIYENGLYANATAPYKSCSLEEVNLNTPPPEYFLE